MKNLTYVNDQQLIEDAAHLLIETHLSWTGSGEGLPSDDRARIDCEMIKAFRKARFTSEEWKNMDEVERGEFRLGILPLYEQAAALADRKWLAAMTLLGIER